jgi:hypothetical protein
MPFREQPAYEPTQPKYGEKRNESNERAEYNWKR